MRKKECIAMILAGGQGSRLGILTNKNAKPAIPFGGKYRIIDFTLSNCTNSDIDTVGVLTQYQPLQLNSYIGSGQSWDLDRINGGVFILPPYVRGSRGEWYKGTANAIYQNMDFVEQYDPEYVLVLSGDHIYKMDYGKMLEYHKMKQGDATIAVIQVPWDEAGRFGLVTNREDGSIYGFQEKPKEPKSNKASMGVYVFSWKVLKEYLLSDEEDPNSSNDFGKDIIPKMLNTDRRLFAYPFKGYWKDVGTIQSLWEANMDLLKDPPEFDLYDPRWRIYSRSPVLPPHYIASCGGVEESIVAEGSVVYGYVKHSVVFYGTFIAKGVEIRDSIIMPNTRIGKNVKINKAIIGEGACIGDDCQIGFDEQATDEYKLGLYSSGITVVGEGVSLPNGSIVKKNAMVDDKFKNSGSFRSVDYLVNKEEMV